MRRTRLSKRRNVKPELKCPNCYKQITNPNEHFSIVFGKFSCPAMRYVCPNCHVRTFYPDEHLNTSTSRYGCGDQWVGSDI